MGEGSGLSRRGFLAGVASIPVVLRLPAGTAQSFTFLSPHEAAVVEEATARLIPGPTDDVLELGHPGAREAGVVRYIDGLLGAFLVDPPRLFAGGPASGRHGGADGFATFQPLAPIQERHWRAVIEDWQPRYRQGVVALDAAAGGDFAAASPLQQDLVLAQDGTGFRELLFDHAIEGWLADPVYGGNADGSGWQAVSFPGDTIPSGYTAAQVSGGDGLDVVDPVGVVATLQALLEELFDA